MEKLSLDKLPEDGLETNWLAQNWDLNKSVCLNVEYGFLNAKGSIIQILLGERFLYFIHIP